MFGGGDGEREGVHYLKIVERLSYGGYRVSTPLLLPPSLVSCKMKAEMRCREHGERVNGYIISGESERRSEREWYGKKQGGVRKLRGTGRPETLPLP